MIELDIKIRSKDNKTLKILLDMMIAALRNDASKDKVDATFSAETDGDTIVMTRKEIVTSDNLNKKR